MDKRFEFEKLSVRYASGLENFIQSLSSFLIFLVVNSFLSFDYGAVLGLLNYKSEERK